MLLILFYKAYTSTRKCNISGCRRSRKCSRQSQHIAADTHLPRSRQLLLPHVRHELRRHKRQSYRACPVRDRSTKELATSRRASSKVCEDDRTPDVGLRVAFTTTSEPEA